MKSMLFGTASLGVVAEPPTLQNDWRFAHLTGAVPGQVTLR